MKSIIDTHYAAYAANDVEGVMATLTDDYTVAPLNGKPWLTNKEGARKMYARHIKTYAMDRTDVLGRMELGNVVIKREHSRPTYSREATDLSESVQARKITALARWRTEENGDVSYFDYRDTLLGRCVSVHQLKLCF